jgi:hypothetical protein
MRWGSRSGAISGSDAGSGISMTRTGLLVNPILNPFFHSSKAGRQKRSKNSDWS